MVADPHLAEQRTVWHDKPVLREIYGDFYRRIAAFCASGRTLEIGGGPGNFKAFAPDVVSTDILAAPWLDARADAHALPFADAAFANVVAVDVLHHLERPALFLDEAGRVLKGGGRLILLEPKITPLSRLFYTFFHPEPVDMNADPLEETARDPGRDPFAANQAIPSLIFGRHKERLEARFPNLALRRVESLSLVAYPLSGGFRSWSLIPAAAVAPLLRIENLLTPLLGPLMAFRMLAVMEKKALREPPPVTKS